MCVSCETHFSLIFTLHNSHVIWLAEVTFRIPGVLDCQDFLTVSELIARTHLAWRLLNSMLRK